MTLRARLALGFLAIALLLAVPLAASLLALRSAKGAAVRLRDEQFAASLALSRVGKLIADVRRAEVNVGVQNGDSASAAFFHASTQTLRGSSAALRSYHLDAMASAVDSAAGDIDRLGQIEIAAFGDHQADMADRVSDQQTLPALQALEARLAKEEEALSAATQQSVSAAVTRAAGAQVLAGALLLAALVTGAVIAVRTTRSISRPVADLSRGMAAVAGGDFEHKLTVASGRTDEFGHLAESYASMSAQLAELDKLKAEFVSIASHELKTPINVIMGYLKLLEENIYGPLGAKQAEVVGIMQTQAASLTRLVKHLLDVSRFEAGAAPLDRTPMTVRGFFEQMQTAHEVLARERDVTFAMTMSDTLPDIVNWDMDRMTEVIGNLLTNAFKFTKPGGRVDLVVSTLDEAIYVAVRDTGIGIAADQVPHVFDKFFQASNQAGASAKGSGLGLAISKEIVEAHDGSIAVESTVGQGTTFSILLPAGTEPAPPSAPKPRSGLDRRTPAPVAS